MYVKYFISIAWKKINEERDQTFIEIAMNIARMSHCMYQHEEEFGVADHKTKNNMLSLLIQPIPHTKMSKGNPNSLAKLEHQLSEVFMKPQSAYLWQLLKVKFGIIS